MDREERSKFVLQFMAVICTVMAVSSTVLFMNGLGSAGGGTLLSMLVVLILCLIAGFA
jgi:hypothetical protein